MFSRRFFWLGGGLGLFAVSFLVPAYSDVNGVRLGYEALRASFEMFGFSLAALRPSSGFSFTSVGEALVTIYLGSLWLSNLVAPLSYLFIARRSSWLRPLLVVASLLPLGIFATFVRDGVCVGFYLWAASLLLLAGAALSSPRGSLVESANNN